ncbi:hypothetical protein F5983_11160 [Streptomyces arboris]|uniref:Uncharacterized protein n=1 Tax=Streptomyces arboris TaxID=2600619 RepID=A0A5N5F2J7_9ACTN|nr:hypothetical protein F5983_11160 [Streptomyces arboris]
MRRCAPGHRRGGGGRGTASGGCCGGGCGCGNEGCGGGGEFGETVSARGGGADCPGRSVKVFSVVQRPSVGCGMRRGLETMVRSGAAQVVRAGR